MSALEPYIFLGGLVLLVALIIFFCIVDYTIPSKRLLQRSGVNYVKLPFSEFVKIFRLNPKKFGVVNGGYGLCYSSRYERDVYITSGFLNRALITIYYRNMKKKENKILYNKRECNSMEILLKGAQEDIVVAKEKLKSAVEVSEKMQENVINEAKRSFS